jgi:CTP:molybdopterin cytidylyltransferase MocA
LRTPFNKSFPGPKVCDFVQKAHALLLESFVSARMTPKSAVCPPRPVGRAPELKSLVLAGGASTRMHADKASFSHHGEPQVKFLARALSRLTRTVCISVRRAQNLNAAFDGLKLLPDREDNIGSLEGLLSAFSYAPFAAWLVVAVDMPGVSERTLQRLVELMHPVCNGVQEPRDGPPGTRSRDI